MTATDAPPPPRGPLPKGGVVGAGDSIYRFFQHVGRVTILTRRTFVTLFRTRLDWRAFVDQLDALGVKSLGIGAATAIFVGIVMAIQFAFSLERFGAKDTVGRIVGLSEARELAPALTSLVVGSRIAAAMAAELGSMSVTQQVDAIRALGADPIRKLVVPRVLAGIIVIPLIACIALVLGVLSAMLICNISFGIEMPFFLSTAIDAVTMKDFMAGMGKTPFFGFLTTILACYLGLETRGGTEGVGRSTASAVVVVSISILIADAVLTQLFLSL
ncbi:MAG: ABC transporter permease [Deltaproteobacteria bacterium]|nr:MAG: ABC transporter permease [Deltaproteobacteria bacterium]